VGYLLSSGLTLTDSLRYHVQYDDGLDNTLVVDGVPIIDKSKLEKLLSKIAKEFSKKGITIKPEDIYTPWDDAKGKNKGFVFSFVLSPRPDPTNFQVYLY
jgi:hypothetical protein